ncbi:hypothetical protein MMC13_002124 [Lambiella insularis]|nr:hypothetical protein [Lambiella insularis]
MGLGPNVGGSEDCLFLDVYAPSSATNSSKLPVYVFIQGGGFNGDGAHMNASGLIPASGMNMVVVSFTYRGGALGFLASAEVQKGASLNNGLKDQRKVLQWVQLNIETFGGDPGHSPMGALTRTTSTRRPRSPSPFPLSAPSHSRNNQYDHLVSRAGCSTASDTLSCLRSLPIADFQKANLNEAFPGAAGPPIFPYNPVLDDDFVTDYPIRSFVSGKFVHVPTIFGDDTNEGTIFTPKTLWTQDDSEAFLVDQYPALTSAQLAQYNTMYAFDSQTPSPYWHHASMAYGETRYICPGIVLSNAMSSNNEATTWNYRYDVLDPVAVAAGLNVAHGAEMPAIWGPSYVDAPASYQTANKNIVPVMQGYWTSFIRSYDPNTYRAAGTPVWEKWVAGSTSQRLRLVAEGTAMEEVAKANPGQSERCQTIAGMELSIDQ